MIFELTRTGSFKGVQFNYDNSVRDSGRKSIFHTFPNSDDVQFEDLGRAPRAFSLNMIISGRGQDYFSKRDAFIKVLDSKGSGELIHPLYGKMTAQLAGIYKINESITEQGRAIFTATFLRVDSFTLNTQPTKRTIDQSRDNIQKGSINSTKGIEFNSDEPIYTNPTTKNSDIGVDGLGTVPKIQNDFLDGVNAIQSNITNISAKFSSIARLITNPLDYSKYSALIREFELTGLLEIADIIDGVGELFTQGRNAIDDAELWLSGIKSIYGYNDEVDESTPTTRQRAEQQANEIAFRNIIQVIGVAQASVAMIEIDYATDEDLQSEVDSIMNQIDKVSNLSGLDPELFDLIKDLKNKLRQAIDQELLSIFRVETITVRTTTLTSLVHSLYGNLDNYDLIRDLNSFNEPSFIEGEVKVVTGG
jgi:prophage DNA circulation protein